MFAEHAQQLGVQVPFAQRPQEGPGDALLRCHCTLLDMREERFGARLQIHNEVGRRRPHVQARGQRPIEQQLLFGEREARANKALRSVSATGATVAQLSDTVKLAARPPTRVRSLGRLLCLVAHSAILPVFFRRDVNSRAISGQAPCRAQNCAGVVME